MRALGFVLSMVLSVSAAAKVKVVASLPDLAAIAQEVGGPHVEVKALVKASQDPHRVDPRPNFLLDLSRADLLIVNGLDLESGWLPRLIVNARNGAIQIGSRGYLDTSSGITKLQVGMRDRSSGDVHPGGNPHYTFDPRAAKIIAAAIAAKLSALDPPNRSAYEDGAARFKTAIDSMMARQAVRFGALTAAQKRIVQYHMSLTYLFEWLGIEQVATIEPQPGIPPNPDHVARVMATMRETKTRVVVQEQHFPRTTSDTLAKLAQAQVVIVMGGTQFDKHERYVDHIEQISSGLYQALSVGGS